MLIRSAKTATSPSDLSKRDFCSRGFLDSVALAGKSYGHVFPYKNQESTGPWRYFTGLQTLPTYFYTCNFLSKGPEAWSCRPLPRIHCFKGKSSCLNLDFKFWVGATRDGLQRSGQSMTMWDGHLHAFLPDLVWLRTKSERGKWQAGHRLCTIKWLLLAVLFPKVKLRRNPKVLTLNLDF